MDKSDLIYHWNRVGSAETAPRPLELNDETLRDGWALWIYERAPGDWVPLETLRRS